MSNDKTYRFISDPGHKENLSGRVRAACVTCRRKKTKCSGEVPCSTCEEKGLVCEGLTERKRPKKGTGRRSRASSARGERRSSHDTESEDGFANSRRTSFESSSTRMEFNDESLRRPTVHLLNLGTSYSNDSGYASGLQSRQGHATPQSLQLDTVISFNTSFAPKPGPTSNNALDISPSASDHQDWSYIGRPASTDLAVTETAGSDISQSAMAMSPAVPTKSMDWPALRDVSSAWEGENANGQTATRLITAAQALEEQALSLRRLATRQETEAADDRRQTITFPIESEGTEATNSSTHTLSGSYDDLFLMLGERSSGSGLTPLPLEFNTWLDVNAGMPSSLGLDQTTSVPQAMTVADVSLLNSTDTALPGVSGFYHMPSGSIGSAQRNNMAMKLNERAANARPSTKSKGIQAQSGFSPLYPWPE